MINSSFAPIIIPTLCRDDHLKKCVESLAANKLALQTELYIGLDFPPSDKYTDGWNRIKQYIPTITGFKKVVLLEAKHNLSAQGNIEFLKEFVRKQGYSSYIFTEDDNVFSPNFLEYANWGLQAFENDRSVFAVIGFKRVNVDYLRNNVYKFPRYVAWGVATWFNRVDRLNEYKDIDRLKDLIKTWPLSIIFSNKVFTAVSIIKMIKTNYILEDTLPSLLPKEEMYCIYPKVSMVRNEGFDGSGLHCGDNIDLAREYLSLVIDDNESFVPKMEDALYCPQLKHSYNKTYRGSNTVKNYLKASIQFLAYKLAGKFWRI